MSGDERDFNNIEKRAVIIFFFCKGRRRRKFNAILQETLGKHASSYATVKNWVAQFKRGDFNLWWASSWTNQNNEHPGDY